jgi:hypothetical protein
VHFVLAFVVLFLTFAFTGHLVYGLRLKAWSTATLSINSSFRALKGDVELTDMYDVAPFTTVVWFWLFLWSQIFVMNNLLLAQLYDHFQVVKAQANSFTTFLLQLKDVLRDVHRREGKKMMCCFCCCRCRKRDDYPSHADMLEDLMDKAGYSPGEKHSVFRTVNGPKRMRKHTEKHVFAGEIPVEHLSEDVQAPAEADLKAMGVDPDYIEGLLEDVVNYREREFDTEEIHVNQMRELVTLAEVEMAQMRKRMDDCQSRMRFTMHDLVRRLEHLERSVHGSLQSLVWLAGSAGVPDKIERGSEAEMYDPSSSKEVVNPHLSHAYRRVMQHLASGRVKRMKEEREKQLKDTKTHHRVRQQQNAYARLHGNARLAQAFGSEDLKRKLRDYAIEKR